MIGEKKPPESMTVDILYTVAMKVLDKQIDDSDSLDNKVRGIFAFVTLIFGALATFIYSQAQRLTAVSSILFWIALVVSSVVVVFSMLAYRVTERKYLIRGQPLADIAELGFPDSLVKNYLLRQIVKQHDYNNTVLTKKASYTKVTLWLTFVDLLVMLSLLFLQIYNKVPNLLML